MQELELTSSVSPDVRHDRHYGGLISLRNESGISVVLRKIPTPDGSLATRHGAGGSWTFEFGEPRGNRLFTDQNGAFVQDVDYQPYGKASSTGAEPGSPLYNNAQWNGGDALAAFGLSQLGARLYDPAIGRFLSRDPLLIPRTAATTNPYAFAMNDPVNSSDPTGLDNCAGKPSDPGDGSPCVREDSGTGGGRSTPGSGGTGGSPSGLWVHLGDSSHEYQGGGGSSKSNAPGLSVNDIERARTVFLDTAAQAFRSQYEYEENVRLGELGFLTSPEPTLLPLRARLQIAWIFLNPLGTITGCLSSGGCSTPFDNYEEGSYQTTSDRDIPNGPSIPGRGARLSGRTPNYAQYRIVAGQENIRRFGSLNEARDAARNWAGLTKDETTVLYRSQVGPDKGKVVGLATADGSRGMAH